MSERRVLTCDRCGKEMSEKHDLDESYFFIRKTTKFSVRWTSPFKDGFGRSELNIDLCPECTEQLDEWLSNYKKEEE
jgi:hypothetical protein